MTSGRHVLITDFYPDRASEIRTAPVVIWYRTADSANAWKNSGMAWVTDMVRTPEQILEAALKNNTEYVRSTWFLLEIGTILRAKVLDDKEFEAYTIAQLTKRLTA